MTKITEKPCRIFGKYTEATEENEYSPNLILEHCEAGKKYQNRLKINVHDRYKIYFKKDRMYVLGYNVEKQFVILQVFRRDELIGEMSFGGVTAQSLFECTDCNPDKMVIKLNFLIKHSEHGIIEKLKRWLFENM